MANNIGGMPPASQTLRHAETPASTSTSTTTSGQPTLSTRDPGAPAHLPDRRFLHQAAAKGDPRVLLDAVLDAMDRLDEIDPQTGRTPLQAAYAGGHEHATQLLIDAGARVHPVAPTYAPAQVSLYAAAEEGRPELLGAVLASSKADLNTPDPLSGLTPLMFAIRGRHLGAAAMLLRAGAQTGQTDARGVPPIVQAARRSWTAGLALLLEHGAVADQTDDLGRTALLVAAGNKDVDMAALLLAHEADVDHADEFGETALSNAVRAGSTELVGLLLDHHADVGRADQSGRTPLMVATQLHFAEGVALLLAHGAQPGAEPDR
jgi:ankyrin repeat protein